MIKQNINKKTIQFANDILSGTLDYSTGVTIKDFSHKSLEKKSNTERELFIIEIYNNEFSSKDFDLVDVSISKDKKEKALSEVDSLMSQFNLNPTLFSLLKEDNLI